MSSRSKEIALIVSQKTLRSKIGTRFSLRLSRNTSWSVNAVVWFPGGVLNSAMYASCSSRPSPLRNSSGGTLSLLRVRTCNVRLLKFARNKVLCSLHLFFVVDCGWQMRRTDGGAVSSRHTALPMWLQVRSVCRCGASACTFYLTGYAWRVKERCCTLVKMECAEKATVEHRVSDLSGKSSHWIPKRPQELTETSKRSVQAMRNGSRPRASRASPKNIPKRGNPHK